MSCLVFKRLPSFSPSRTDDLLDRTALDVGAMQVLKETKLQVEVRILWGERMMELDREKHGMDTYWIFDDDDDDDGGGGGGGGGQRLAN